MGFFKDLLGLTEDKKDTRPKKTERIRVDDYDTWKTVYDSEGHWNEDLRWNPEAGRWDKLDMNGNVTGHIERDVFGDMRHTDLFERTVGVDKIKDSRTLEHYDSKGKKIGYTTKDYSNNLTKHTYIEEEKDIFGRPKKSQESSSRGILERLGDIAEYNRQVEAIHKKYEEERKKIYEKYRTEEDDDSLYDEDEDYDDLFVDDDDDEYKRRRRRRDYGDDYDFDDDDDSDDDDAYDDDEFDEY